MYDVRDIKSACHMISPRRDCQPGQTDYNSDKVVTLTGITPLHVTDVTMLPSRLCPLPPLSQWTRSTRVSPVW